ncbi:hypothetical protein D3C74_202530 [compost metagenome]
MIFDIPVHLSIKYPPILYNLISFIELLFINSSFVKANSLSTGEVTRLIRNFLDFETNINNIPGKVDKNRATGIVQ